MKLALLVLAALSVGCVRPANGGERPDGFRFLTGSVQIPDEDLLGRQVTGLQVAAIAIGDGVDVFPSAVFDGSRIETSRFAALVAHDRAFVAVLQVPSATTSGPGTLVAVLRFNSGNGETTLVPPGDEDIELGTLTIDVASKTLVVSDAHNPAAQVDTDDDGSVDVLDPDDDGDDTPDISDPDANGDGVDDATQLLTSLPDEDSDGTPDLLEG